MIIEMSVARSKLPEDRRDSAWSKDPFAVRSEPSVQGGRMPRGPRTTPPWAHGELHSSCEIAPPISMSEEILGGKRFLHPGWIKPRGQTCRTRTRDGRCTREM